MKKTLLLAGIAGLLSFNANAETANTSNKHIRPVLGVDYSYSMFSLSDDEGYNMIAADDIHSFALSGGLKFNKHFGIEGFYQNTLVMK